MSAQANTGTVLDRILEARRAEVDHRKRVLPETALKYGVKAATPLRDFSAALCRDGWNVLAELKPASPSRGVIREPFEPVTLGQALESAGACALSVLTEGEFFRGTLKNLRDARKSIQIPVLRKDFIFDPWQIWETRANDADSFLLIVAVLEDELLRDLIALGRELGMEPLVEVHTAEELDRAVGVADERAEEPGHLDSDEGVDDEPGAKEPAVLGVACDHRAVRAAEDQLGAEAGHGEHQGVEQDRHRVACR